MAEVEAQEVMVDGQRMWALHRPGVTNQDGAIVSPEGAAICVFFDGTRDLRAVQRAVYERYGQLLYVERIHELATALNRAGLLEPIEVRGERIKTPTEPGRKLALAPTENLRPAVHAGAAYAADPARLDQALRSYFMHPEGPGAPPGPYREGKPLLGLVVPHIDLDRGGPTYAHGYRALAERSDADLFVIFGTAHISPDEMFTLTRRHYDTPFGPVPTDMDALGILEKEIGPALFRDEAVHSEEHSIEFQAVYLRYLFPNRRISILPVLCSSLYGLAAQDRGPRDEPAVEKFLDALAKATEGRKVLYIAAADLAHVGRMYGDDEMPSPEKLQDVEKRDLESLEFVRSGDADGFFDDVTPDVSTRRVCGLAPIYMMTRATGAAPAQLVKYTQWFGVQEASAVSFAVLTVDAQ